MGSKIPMFEGYSLVFCQKSMDPRTPNFAKGLDFLPKIDSSENPKFPQGIALIFAKGRWFRKSLFVKGYSLDLLAQVGGSENPYFSKGIALNLFAKNRWVQNPNFPKDFYKKLMDPKIPTSRRP